MKSLLKSFRAGQLAKVLLLSLALTGAMSVFNAQAQTWANACKFNGTFCPEATMGCVCLINPPV